MRGFHLHRRPRPVRRRVRKAVRLRGEINAANASATGQHLLDVIRTGPDVLEVDLARVTYLSPDGCAAFFAALKAARQTGTLLVIIHAHPRAESTLREVGLWRALNDADASSGRDSHS